MAGGGTHVDGAVVLVDLDAEVVAYGGEVVWLGHVAQAVVLGRGPQLVGTLHYTATVVLMKEKKKI